ncbi:MAG: M3 family metallopeptidase [Bacteroidetes bacterium]|nr:M3 family metallopeptidase [Bacteroidota bacterium]MCL2303431.1 M3 family metallopeptidase [Lentimicrobiaceae bacterium]
MKKLSIITLAILALMWGCNSTSHNPFFAEKWDTPFGVNPFNEIKFEHYKPAFLEGMKRHNAEIDAIVNNPEEPTFENTVVALDAAGLFLNRVVLHFFNMISSERTDKLAALDEEMAPILAKHADEIAMNPKLFERVKAVYNNERSNLQGEDLMLLEETYKNFVRGGANLDEESKAELMKINEELSVLGTKFSNNVLNDQNAFVLIIDNEADLAGLPAAVVAAAAERAKNEGHEGKWMFKSLQRSVFTPLLTFLDNRDLREKVWRAYVNVGNNGNENDNNQITSRIASLELEKAKLFGYKTAADFILEDRMAKNPQTVYQFLTDLWKPTQKVLQKEVTELQKIIDAENGGFKLQPWDWRYYAEKVKQQKYDFDETSFREYLPLENVIQGCFDLTTRLWGVTWEERFDIPKFNPANRTWLMKEADGTEIGIFIADYHPRASKRGGAWMWYFRQQEGWPKNNVMPIVTNVSNYTAPSGDQPALLSIDEVGTLFHEMGHALHMLFSRTKYRSLSGTNVKRDFVEMPSSIMENWAFEPEFLKTYAKHYITGEVVPNELIEQMERAGKFNQGFVTGENLASAWVDYYWYNITEEVTKNGVDFELEATKKIHLIPELMPRHRTTYFTHIFSGGYAMGYYSYLWAEVLDADMYQAFVESGNIYNLELAQKLRTVFSKGGTVDPAELFRQFRGTDPNPDALLKRRGLK